MHFTLHMEIPRPPEAGGELQFLHTARLLYIQLGLCTGLLVLLYYPVIAGMLKDWETNANYSHGYLVPAIAGYMIWTVRKDLKNVRPMPSNRGLLLLIFGLCQLLAASAGSEYFMQRTSIIIVLFGIALFLMGKGFSKKIFFPVMYLIFMIPVPTIIWNKFAFPMKLFASYMSTEFIKLLGMPIFREGNLLYLPCTTLEVADACSGLRSLTSLLALSAAFVFFTERSKLEKWFLFFLAIPVAILTNVIRLTVTAVLASWYGEEIARGFLHEFSGWLIYLLGLAILFGVNALLPKHRRN